MGRYAIEIPVTKKKLWPELGLGSGFDSISPHNISKSNFPEKFAKKLGRSLK